MKRKTGSNELRMASLAHATILIGYIFLFAFIAPLIIWFKENKSEFVKFQAKQATAYQLIALFALVMAGPAVALLFPQNADLNALVKTARLVVYTLFSLYALYGAYSCSRGRDFRYLLIGGIL